MKFVGEMFEGLLPGWGGGGGIKMACGVSVDGGWGVGEIRIMSS